MRLKLWTALLCCLLLSKTSYGQHKTFESKELRQAASLLSKENPYAEVLYHFTEDYLNQLLVLGEKERNWKMEADDVRIEEGGLEKLRLVSGQTALAMSAKDNRYTVELTNGKIVLIRLSCPMSYQLITRKKLKELEAEYLTELAAFRVPASKASPEVDKRNLQKVAPQLYLQRGTDYFLESINNNLYYVEEKGIPALAYDPGYIAESICNMFLSEATPCDVSLKLTVRQYGFKRDELKLPLKQWIAYNRSKQCDIYVGVENIGIDKLKVCVFVVNEHFKYNHVLNAEIPYTLLGEKRGDVEADITIFIPTHNLKALFEELNLTKKTR